MPRRGRAVYHNFRPSPYAGRRCPEACSDPTSIACTRRCWSWPPGAGRGVAAGRLLEQVERPRPSTTDASPRPPPRRPRPAPPSPARTPWPSCRWAATSTPTTRQAPYRRQRVVAAGTAPDGIEPHGQICFAPDGSRRFVVAETRPAAAGTPAPRPGFGLYQLTGDGVGTFRVAAGHRVHQPGCRLGRRHADLRLRLHQATAGCSPPTWAPLSATDSQAGAADGQLIEWFPPFTGATSAHCVVATGLAVPQGLAVEPDGTIDAGLGLGPHRRRVALPGLVPHQGRGLLRGGRPDGRRDRHQDHPGRGQRPGVAQRGGADPGQQEPGGDAAPSTASSTSSALDGTFTTTLLTPTPAGPLGATPFATGTPLGVAVNADGAVFYADPGLTRVGGAVAPAARAGLGAPDRRHQRPAPGPDRPQPGPARARRAGHLRPVQGVRRRRIDHLSPRPRSAVASAGCGRRLRRRQAPAGRRGRSRSPAPSATPRCRSSRHEAVTSPPSSPV